MTQASALPALVEGTVESISKTSIIVSVAGAPTTLQGQKVEELAPSLKLGDVVEFDNSPDTITVIAKKGAKKAATTARREGSSPAAPAFADRVDW